MLTLHDSLACSVFPAPRAFPTRTLAAADNPNGNYGRQYVKPFVVGSHLYKTSGKQYSAMLPCRLRLSARILWTEIPAQPHWSLRPGSLPPRTTTIPDRAWAYWGWPGGWRAPIPADIPSSSLCVTGLCVRVKKKEIQPRCTLEIMERAYRSTEPRREHFSHRSVIIHQQLLDTQKHLRINPELRHHWHDTVRD